MCCALQTLKLIGGSPDRTPTLLANGFDVASIVLLVSDHIPVDLYADSIMYSYSNQHDGRLTRASSYMFLAALKQQPPSPL